MVNQLLRKIEQSDRNGASELLKDAIARDGEAWAVHLSLFPVVQRVLNPPFINPHLPKMYRICREFLPYLEKDEVAALVRLEVNEYAQRPKLEVLPKPAPQTSSVSFQDVETAVREGQRERVAALLNAFLEQKGKAELARNLLLLGSGYMGQSLGHAVSCTAFILLEMIDRSEQDPWPAVTTLADYFCKGQFHTTPALRGADALPSEKALLGHLARATSGNGIVNLHHTITRYAIERVRHLLSDAEYVHMIACWIEFMGAKEAEAAPAVPSVEGAPDYEGFYSIFSSRAEAPVLSCLAGLIPLREGQQRLGRYLIKGVCDRYQGSYDPHFLTGLAATLWVVDRYGEQVPIALNALRQYLDYFFTQMVY